ncbi:hypothetical protein V6Z98_010207 [Aspergillus fumigatus]
MMKVMWKGETTPTLGWVKTDYTSAAQSVRSRSSEEYERGEAVNWDELDKTEEQEPRGEGSDESTALLLARLEQENNALATNPKSVSRHRLQTRASRAQSLHQIKRLINEDPRSSLRYSQLPPPPMTELEFWAALVADYPQTAQRLPTLTSNKIRGGIPPPLRGVVWPSLAGARDSSLLVEYERLCGESSPYEGLIGKDIGRSFPNVEMFRDPHGEGQQMLAKVLKCFSLYDTKIGYCQGLGFVVGPLLMHMTDAEAFCVLVRLMDHYDLRTCYQPDLSGLHLRVYQFQNLLARHRPSLFAHLESLNVEPIYVSQWFLSFFAVSCPLPMLLRIYDVIFLEGACETLMRVALSLMQRNEKKIMAYTEFEDVMQFLLSRSLWDTYACHADDFVNDFVSLTSLVTKESLQALEASYNQSQGGANRHHFPSDAGGGVEIPGPVLGGIRLAGEVLQSQPQQWQYVYSRQCPPVCIQTEHDLHAQFDRINIRREYGSDGVSAEPPKPRANDLQRQHADLTRELQQEREEREEDQQLAQSMLKYIKEIEADDPPAELIRKAEERFVASGSAKRVSIPQTKQQLREDLNRWKEMHEIEAGRCLDLTRRIDEHEQENSSLREQLREARSRIQDGYRDRQRLERTIRELRTIKTATPDSPPEAFGSPTSDAGETRSPSGLRELKLGRSNSQKSTTFNKRSSSLGLQSVLSTENHKPAAEETLLLELVNAKTAEAVAKQELEEVKAKLDSLRKMIGGQASLARSDSRNSSTGRSSTNLAKSATEPVHSGGGGFFSGWGRRAVSSNDSYAEAR